VLTPLFAPDASRVLDELEKDPARDRLVAAIWDTIDLIAEHPTSREARRRMIRSAKGHSMWLVPVPNRHAEDPWIVLWQPRGDDALIAYVGPDHFRLDNL
jgi:hypothetical protein